jgi:Polyketide cyclase / dehydrase and lipid transport
MKWLLGIVGVLVAAVAIIYAIGFSLPRDHVACVERVIPQSIENVAARIRDVRAYPEWRDIAVENLSADGDTIAYVEIADGERIAYRRTEPEADHLFVSEITDETLPFGGQWRITLTPAGAGARVSIEENGHVRDPLYRFFSAIVFGHTSSMELYLDKLAASFA